MPYRYREATPSAVVPADVAAVIPTGVLSDSICYYMCIYEVHLYIYILLYVTCSHIISSTAAVSLADVLCLHLPRDRGTERATKKKRPPDLQLSDPPSLCLAKSTLSLATKVQNTPSMTSSLAVAAGTTAA